MSHVKTVITLLKTNGRVSIRQFAEADPTIVYELRARISNARKILAKEGFRVDHHRMERVSDNYWELVKEGL